MMAAKSVGEGAGDGTGEGAGAGTGAGDDEDWVMLGGGGMTLPVVWVGCEEA